jgi:hypothetical protein
VLATQPDPGPMVKTMGVSDQTSEGVVTGEIKRHQSRQEKSPLLNCPQFFVENGNARLAGLKRASKCVRPDALPQRITFLG